MRGAEVPTATTTPERTRRIADNARSAEGFRSPLIDSPFGKIFNLSRKTPILPVRKAKRMQTSQPVIPRSTKEWTEKSASIPLRVKKVP